MSNQRASHNANRDYPRVGRTPCASRCVTAEPLEPRRLMSGGSWSQVVKLVASDGAPYDLFGYSVAFDGNTALLGSIYDDDNGGDSGSAYLFDTTTGTQIGKLTASDGAELDYFGHAVALSGNIALVGSVEDDNHGTWSNSGSAYVFDALTGQQLAKLTPADSAAGDVFGWSVALDGDIAVIGSPWDGDNGAVSGSAYVFNAITGQPIAKLTPADGAAGDQFGISVAIDGNIALVGSPRDDDNGTDSGSAYLFDVTTGQQIGKLTPTDGAAGDFFGESVSLSGNIALVGSWSADDNGINSGSAYPFDITTGQQIAKLLPDDVKAGDGFGYSVAVSGNTAVVGNFQDDDHGTNSGSAYLFDVTTGAQIAKLLPVGAAAGDMFGVSVAISGNTAVIGSSFDEHNGIVSGSAYVFRALQSGDLNGDGVVNNLDIAPFVLALTNPAGYAEQYPGISAPQIGDLNGDGAFNNLDIAPFVALLTGDRAAGGGGLAAVPVGRGMSTRFAERAVGIASMVLDDSTWARMHDFARVGAGAAVDFVAK